MKLIVHRRNTLLELLSTDERYGVEVDIRSYGNNLIIHHEPCTQGEPFDKWLEAYNHGTLILNVKEEGLESFLIPIMEKKGIDDYFFLDQSFPYLVKWSEAGAHRCAVRVSEFETIETALLLASQIDWVWVDCFTQFPLQGSDAKMLQDAGLKLCLVSPELHGREAGKEIPKLISLLNERKIQAEAVCTKRPDIWETQLNTK